MADQDVVVTNAITEPVPVQVVNAVPVQVVNDFRAQNAFQVCLEKDLEPAFDAPFNFDIPDGKRLTIELITAQVMIPIGEGARLRLMTHVDTIASNIDLVLTSQGQVGGQEVLVATHAIRAYADDRPAASEDFQVSVNRDNGETSGHALICVSGYLVDLAA